LEQITRSHASAHESVADIPHTVTHAFAVGSYLKRTTKIERDLLCQKVVLEKEESKFKNAIPPRNSLLALLLLLLHSLSPLSSSSPGGGLNRTIEIRARFSLIARFL